jgi:hypothetical protein
MRSDLSEYYCCVQKGMENHIRVHSFLSIDYPMSENSLYDILCYHELQLMAPIMYKRNSK